MLLRMEFKASTSAEVPEAPCFCKTWSVWFLMYCSWVICWFWGDLTPWMGAVDRLLALKYGCNCFKRTRTRATLSSLSKFSIGVSLLKVNKYRLEWINRNLHLFEIQVHVFVTVQNIWSLVKNVIQEFGHQESCPLVLLSRKVHFIL